MTGLNIKPRSSAQVLPSPEEPVDLDNSSTEQQVAAFLQAKGRQLECQNVEACNPLPSRTTRDKPAVFMRYVNRKHKIALLK